LKMARMALPLMPLNRCANVTPLGSIEEPSFACLEIKTARLR
jgi:hypothetical protein